MDQELVILRVANGWVARPRDNPNDFHGAPPSVWQVARSLGELAQIVTDWAAKQETPK